MKQALKKSSGFTLIELLIAISLMAVISIMCWRGLDSVLKSRTWLTNQSEDLKGMALGFAQMEDDLRRSWITRQMKISAATVGFVNADVEKNIVGMTLLRDGAQMMPGQVQQVAYRLRGGVFERGFTKWAVPTSVSGKLTDQLDTFTWQPLFSNIESLSWRVYVNGAWVDGRGLTDQRAAAQILTASTPGLGVEVTLIRANQQPVVRIFGVKD